MPTDPLFSQAGGEIISQTASGPDNLSWHDMHVHLIDGTYELFRHYFAVPSSVDTAGNPIGAVRGVVGSIAGMLEGGATHVGVATDHVIESFRNRMYAGYKTGEGVDPELMAQFGPLESALDALGVTLWPMIEEEADDGLASAARLAGADPRVERVWICTPDKDLAQSVVGDRIVQFDRRQQLVRDADRVREKFGVGPESIPDLLALTGDSADGFPGLPGWGQKSAATVLASYEHLEHIPEDDSEWNVRVRGAARLAATLVDRREEALLYRTLATLRDGIRLFDSVDELQWKGPRPEFQALAASMNAMGLWNRVVELWESNQTEAE